ncbi:hypothetical protein KDA82_14050, partial [Streptomyces daliensis]|nr:hypothetical protein [Streptomyces daliensis]
QGGPYGRLDAALERSHYVGSTVTRRLAGRVKAGTPVALYRVEKTLHLRRSGEPSSEARPFRVVTLDWMSEAEARRLRGWDDGSRLRTEAPSAPEYLTRNHPRHLGQTRAERFTPAIQTPQPPGQPPAQPSAQLSAQPPGAGRAVMDTYVDSVMASLQRAYPELIAASWEEGARGSWLSQVMRGRRASEAALGNRRHVREALANTRQVMEGSDRHTLEQSLEMLSTTGVRIELEDPHTFRRGHLSVALTAKLTGRRYEGTSYDRTLRTSVMTSERGEQSTQATIAAAAGAEVGISPRSHDKSEVTGWPGRIGTIGIGLRAGGQIQRSTQSGVVLHGESVSASTGPSHLYGYDVSLGATVEGYRRPRAWARLMSLGVLGMGFAVSPVESRRLLEAGEETLGHVVLAAPSAHSAPRSPANARVRGRAPTGASEAGDARDARDTRDTRDARDAKARTTAPAKPASATGVPATGVQATGVPATAAPARTAPKEAEHLTPDEAERLVDRPWSVPRNETAEAARIRELMSRPVAVASAHGGRLREKLGLEAADEATGGSWHTATPAAPLRTALGRALTDNTVTGHLGQVLGRWGMRLTALNASGPYQSHYLKAAVHGEVTDPVVVGDPERHGTELTTGAERRIIGAAARSTRVTGGLQGAYMHQHDDGHGPVFGSYSSAAQISAGRTVTRSLTQSAGRDTVLSPSGRMYLVSADVEERVAVRAHWSAAFGLLGTRSVDALRRTKDRVWRGAERLRGTSHDAPAASPPDPGASLRTPHAAGRKHRVADGVLIEVPMPDAIETGLAPDGLPATTPQYTAGGYRLPGWAQGNRFFSHPLGRLDASPVAERLLPRLRSLGVRSDDRDAVLQALGPDALNGQLIELTGEGVTVPVRAHGSQARFLRHLHLGARQLNVRVKLTPRRTTVRRVRTGCEFEDYRTRGVSGEVSVARDTVRDLGAGVAQSAFAGRGELAAMGPSLAENTSSAQQNKTSEGTSSLRMPNIATTQGHGEVITEYDLTVTVEEAGKDARPETFTSPVGELRELMPLSVLRPETRRGARGAAGALGTKGRPDAGTETGTDTGSGTSTATATKADAVRQGLPENVPSPPEAIRVWRAQDARAGGPEAWRRRGTHDGGLSTPPETGFLAVSVLGAGQVRDALTLAAGQSYGVGARTAGELSGDGLRQALAVARHTPLTHLGAQTAHAMEEATGQTGLTAFLPHALRPEGHQLPGIAAPRLLGESARADIRLYARPDVRKAVLLTVENAPRMEGMRRDTESGGQDVSHSGAHEGQFGTTPFLSTTPAGTVVPGATGTGYAAPDGAVSKGGLDTTRGGSHKVEAPRAMLFALPVSWLAVADVHRTLHDNAATGAVRDTFGGAPRGPRGAETETVVLAWVREDIATRMGLINSDTFPKEAGDAWNTLGKAYGALSHADDAYYTARAAVRHAWLELPESARQEARRAGETGDFTRSEKDGPALAEWKRAAAETALWHGRADEAAADVHRLRTEAERLTAWYRLPAHDRAPAPVRGPDVSASLEAKAAEVKAQGVKAQGVPEPAPEAAPARGSWGARVPKPEVPAYEVPAWLPQPPPAYKVDTPDKDADKNAPTTLTAPNGGPRYTVHDVPHDGSSLLHALAYGADRLGLLDRLLPPGARPEATGGAVRADAVRQRLAEALDEPRNADLAAMAALDPDDTYTPADLTRSGVTLRGEAEREEFAETGNLPRGTSPTAGQRLALIHRLLNRPAVEERASWDHDAADLMPALGARVLGVPVTVVTKDGAALRFPPSAPDEGQDDKGAKDAKDARGAKDVPEDAAAKAPGVLLHLSDDHFRIALPEGERFTGLVTATTMASAKPTGHGHGQATGADLGTSPAPAPASASAPVASPVGGAVPQRRPHAAVVAGTSPVAAAVPPATATVPPATVAVQRPGPGHGPPSPGRRSRR